MDAADRELTEHSEDKACVVRMEGGSGNGKDDMEGNDVERDEAPGDEVMNEVFPQS